MPHEKSASLKRAKSGAGRRAMLAREPKLLENAKNLLVLKGHRTSETVTTFLHDLHLLKKPDVKKLQRKNDLLPFEAGGETHIENLCRLSDCSLFALGNHTKKRPNNIVFGRMYDFRILDMLEFGIENFGYPTKKRISSSLHSAPLLLFNGDDWDVSPEIVTARSLLTDAFRCPADIQKLNVSGVDRVIVFSLSGDKKVLFRHYQIVLRKNGDSRLPRVELEEVGPSFDLILRRSRVASEPMMRTAMKQPRDPRLDWRTKNVSKNAMGDKEGRIHLGKQDLSGLALARMKGLQKSKGKRKRALQKENPDVGDGSGDGNNIGAGSTMEDGASPVKKVRFA